MFKIEKLDLLVSVYIFCVIASEVMGTKTVPLANIFGFQLNTTTAILLLPLIYSINDVVTEVYGPERARSIVRSSLVVIALLLLTALLFTSLPPSQRFMSMEKA